METAEKKFVYTDEQLLALVTEATRNVFSVMLGGEAEYKETLAAGVKLDMPLVTCMDADEDCIASSVGYAGKVNGAIFMYLGESLSAKLACNMLSLTPDEVKEEGNEMINDALGELMNMTVGNFKNKLCDDGFYCELTVPSIVRGRQFAIETPASDAITRRFYRFEYEGTSFIMDVQVKPGS